jgi:hypothetical protein
VKAIEDLMKKRGRFDYILLETTGLADPGLSMVYLAIVSSSNISLKSAVYSVVILVHMVFLVFVGGALEVTSMWALKSVPYYCSQIIS